VEAKMVRQSLVMQNNSPLLAKIILVTLAVALISSCTTPPKNPVPNGGAVSRTSGAPNSVSTSAQDTPPAAPREFRAMWVATVANIDWPSRKDLSVPQQQAEIIQIVERAKSLNLNALILQVRTSADALYESRLEPWSEFLTGTQGKPPSPYYDPLKMWVDEAHKRGIELHAWFNPYRALHNQARSPPSPMHIANTNPAVVKSYGGYLWMDPGEPSASKQTLDVILDVVRRYDIDGVHIDDYFYPYPVPVTASGNAPGAETPVPTPDDTPSARAEIDFPDEPAWKNYRAHGGTLARADWRRQNVNELIEKIYTGIKREKAWVKFGISPFGLGKPDRRPPGINGFSQYDKLYADAELWLNKGWLDYFTPQLYWPIEQKAQAFEVLLDYWIKENTQRRHLWPGLFTSRINDTAKSWQPGEIVNQIGVSRSRNANDAVTGHVHYSAVALTQNRRGISETLSTSLYRGAALIPASTWLSRTPPASPSLTLTPNKTRRGTVSIQMQTTARDAVAQYAVWTRTVNQTGNTWQFSLVPAISNITTGTANGEWTADLSSDSNRPAALVISAVDRFGNESERLQLRVDGQQISLTR
jgi:uncharacterized lipoprotein YddW (UPF0748 family)